MYKCEHIPHIWIPDQDLHSHKQLIELYLHSSQHTEAVGLDQTYHYLHQKLVIASSSKM